MWKRKQKAGAAPTGRATAEKMKLATQSFHVGIPRHKKELHALVTDEGPNMVFVA